MSGKWKAGLLLVVMFSLGMASGVALQNYRISQRPMVRRVYAARRLRQLKAQLHLSPAQEQALRDIFDKAHERATQINEEVSWDLADIHRDSVKAIRQVLTPDQVRKFDQLHKKYHSKHDSLPADDLDNSSLPADAQTS